MFKKVIGISGLLAAMGYAATTVVKKKQEREELLQAQADACDVNHGIRTRNEVRAERGIPLIQEPEANRLSVTTATGINFLNQRTPTPQVDIITTLRTTLYNYDDRGRPLAETTITDECRDQGEWTPEQRAYHRVVLLEQHEGQRNRRPGLPEDSDQ
jgi:hypothetical protein